MRNHLATATSAYLRQHADNPVWWYEWGEEALSRARELDRPIFLSIGYAACHWCHVMAHESFEDDLIAAYLNEHFVAIKVDREERPDLDAVYMAATQAVSGHGGWPMSVFLLPDGRPFLAGTYFPPVDRGGQAGFPRLLAAVVDGWASRRGEIEQQADEITLAIRHESQVLERFAPAASTPSHAELSRGLVRELVARARDLGGFSDAPKFPRPSYLEALLPYRDEPEVGEVLRVNFDAMSRAGLYDHFAGGFARYSVDDRWHVPHFEKMLSDQALLALAYLEASAAMSEPTWRQVAVDTLRFVVRELDVGTGFASSLDADSDGHEGTHATWRPDDVRDVLARAGLANDADAVIKRWRLGETTFEGRAIPQLADGEPFITPDHLRAALDVLCLERRRRPLPGRDDKVILEWNAMWAVAAYASDEPDLIARADTLLESLSQSHRVADVWYRTDGQRALATAADLGWYVEALLAAFATHGDVRYLDHAALVLDYLRAHFFDGDVPTRDRPDVGNGVFSASDLARDVVVRPKDVFDGATRSTHAVVAGAFARYGIVRGDDDALVVAERLVALVTPLMREHPSAVPDALRAHGLLTDRTEVVLPGAPDARLHLVRSTFVNNVVLITGTGNLPLLDGRSADLAYVCEHGVCQLPAVDLPSLASQLHARSVAKDDA